ncbi:hypothetical protein [Mesorhizobium sp. ORM16]|uniref:hypothetical protein n=1 Tax=Mesorhizobium sp. ORM16 TaxID=3376989 RepID=UPI00385728A3
MTIAPDQLVTWVTAVAGVGVAVVGGIAGYLSAGWRFREVQLSYEQKTRDSYLDNARKVAVDVYVPLSVAVSALSRAYLEFKVHVDADSNVTPIGAINRFKGARRGFEKTLTGLTDRGATAYLTLSLEEKLASFSSFLNESLAAQTIIKRLILQPKFYGVADTVVYRGEDSWLVRWSPIFVAITQMIPIAGIKLRAISETLCAPITSDEFEKCFREDTLTISALIKEVTLGSR